jgi:cytochrome c peroxidase
LTPAACQHAPYFHDGSAATLDQVVATYNTRRSLGLSAQQSADLVQYLKSL